VLVILWMGIYPQPFLRRLDLCVAQVIHRVQPGPTSLARPQPIRLAERSR